MDESLNYTPETTTILFIGYTRIQNKKFKVKKNKNWFSSEDNNENSIVIIL